MKTNNLQIIINKPVSEVFAFTTTPPNSTLWIPSVINEETTEWPIKVGTIYKLENEIGEVSEVTVAKIKTNEFIEWVSKDYNYHCRYTFNSIKNNSCELMYSKWVDQGDIEGPFIIEILNKLKSVLENKLK